MLRRNIPGRYGTWASDDDDDTRGDEDEDAASVPDDPEPEPPESRAVPEALRCGEAPAAAGKDGRQGDTGPSTDILRRCSAPRSCGIKWIGGGEDARKWLPASSETRHRRRRLLGKIRMRGPSLRRRRVMMMTSSWRAPEEAARAAPGRNGEADVRRVQRDRFQTGVPRRPRHEGRGRGRAPARAELRALPAPEPRARGTGGAAARRPLPGPRARRGGRGAPQATTSRRCRRS